MVPHLIEQQGSRLQSRRFFFALNNKGRHKNRTNNRGYKKMFDEINFLLQAPMALRLRSRLSAMVLEGPANWHELASKGKEALVVVEPSQVLPWAAGGDAGLCHNVRINVYLRSWQGRKVSDLICRIMQTFHDVNIELEGWVLVDMKFESAILKDSKNSSGPYAEILFSALTTPD